MPDHYPDYPSPEQVLDYFRSYARHFNLRPHIRFNTRVSEARLLPNGRWQLCTEDGATATFDYLLTATTTSITAPSPASAYPSSGVVTRAATAP